MYFYLFGFHNGFLNAFYYQKDNKGYINMYEYIDTK